MAGAETIHAQLSPGAAVLDLGGGAGGVAGELAALGHPVVVLDEGLRVDDRFAAVLLAGDLIDTPDEERRQSLPATARHHLADGGQVFGQWPQPAAARLTVDALTRALDEAGLLHTGWIADDRTWFTAVRKGVVSHLPGSPSHSDGFLQATREGYDATVPEYVDMVTGALEESPLDRALLGVFAELVRAGGGPIADVGCGPGRVTAYLHRLGADAFGIDLSPEMIAHARRTYPGLRFDVGSMLALDLPDASLGGLLAYYSIIHLPWERRPEALAEFHRVLAPGGYLMLVFQVGDVRRHRDEVFGHPVFLDWYRQQPEEVAQLLRDAGFALWSTTVQEPTGPEAPPAGYLLATRTQGPLVTGSDP